MLIKSFTNLLSKSFIRNKMKDFDVIPSCHNYCRLYTKGVYSPPPTAEILFESMKGNPHEKLNSPKAGWRTAGELPLGKTSFQLYSVSTPNGQKVGIMLEELGVEYDAFKVNLLDGDQYKSRFFHINPNSRIPIAIDIVNGQEVRLFESGSILIYLAEKYQRFLPTDPIKKAEIVNWLFWQTSNFGALAEFGHYFVNAPDDKHETRDYCLGRYSMEVKRLLSVLEDVLRFREFIFNTVYTIADMAIFPWVLQLRRGYRHSSGNTAAKFLSLETTYPATMMWCDRLLDRPAVKKGLRVCEWTKEHSKPWLYIK